MVEKLLRGHGQFHGDSTEEERSFLGRLASEGQSPGALYVGCSDSRVVPEILTASSPGDLFVVRNVANLVPPFGHASVAVGAALEYAVAVLEVPHVIVCGHYGCGGVEAAFGGLEGVRHLPTLTDWLADVFPVMDGVREDIADEPELTRDQILRRAVEHNTVAQVAQLWSYPVVRKAIEAKKLHLHAWIYDLHTQGLSVFDAESQGFVASSAILPLLRSSCLHSGVLDARMMDFPLTISHLLGRARALFADVEVVSRLPDKRLHRSTYGAVVERCERLARALQRLGVKPGDAVATLGWNHRQHLECYLGVPSMGAIVHTLNIRLHPDEIAYIANHAEDKVVVVDGCLLPLFEKFRAKLTSVKHVIVVRDDGDQTAIPSGDLDYETLLAAENVAPSAGGFGFGADTPFPSLDERSAAMICYTSGTTGNPKGVVYSHRSTILHALAISLKDSVGIGSDDVVLPVVPMFHASAWGTPFASISSGAKLVFPGPHLDPTSLLDLMEQEKVTVAAGVPTIWLGILQLLDQHPGRWNLSSVRTMLIGGAAAPPSLIEGFEKRHGLEVTHAWGMTETNPLGTLARVKPAVRKRGPEAVMSARASQGLPVPFVELRHVDDKGSALPWDGAAMGELEVRGPWVSSSYLGDEGKDRFTADGWFRTGDVVTIDADGYVRITDRSKDVVKSGGEWISSVALENALMAHPAVLEAAVFAGRHPKWDERPIAAVVLKPNAQVTDEQLSAHLAPQFAKYWLPDAYVYIEQIPRTSTGKFLKTKLRELYGDLLVKASTPLADRGLDPHMSAYRTTRRSPFVMAAVLTFVSAAALSACSGDEPAPATETEPGATEDDVKVDTSTKLARAQYDANVAFGRGYKARCKSTGAKKRVLLTGFGRFMTVTDNATGRMLASLVPGAAYPETSPPPAGTIDPPAPQLSVGSTTLDLEGVGKVDVCALILPVYWDLASVLIAREIQAFQPSLVVMNGVYPGASWLTLELGTINRAVGEYDGSGNLKPVGGDGSYGFWGEAPLLEGLPPEDDARGLLLSYDEVRAAAEATIATHRDELGEGPSFGDIMTDVKYGGFPRDNTYLCNNTAYVTSYLLDHPGKSVPLLRASQVVKGKSNQINTRIDFDGRKIPRVFVHWPDALVQGHIASGADVLRTIIRAQLLATTPAVRGDNDWADPSLAGTPR